MKFTTRKNIVVASIVGIIIVVVILIIAFAGNKKDANKKEGTENDLVVGEMIPVEKGSLRYTFDGINWKLVAKNEDTALVETNVGFYFDNFTRHADASPAKFGRPFHIGTYQGACVERSGINAADEKLLGLGNPLGFVFCEFDGRETFVGLFQKNELVSAYRWDTENNEPVHIRDINITTIVTSGNSTKSAVVKQENISEPSTKLVYPPRRNSLHNEHNN